MAGLFIGLLHDLPGILPSAKQKRLLFDSRRFCLYYVYGFSPKGELTKELHVGHPLLARHLVHRLHHLAHLAKLLEKIIDLLH